jgi:hypothetical protein
VRNRADHFRTSLVSRLKRGKCFVGRNDAMVAMLIREMWHLRLRNFTKRLPGVLTREGKYRGGGQVDRRGGQHAFEMDEGTERLELPACASSRSLIWQIGCECSQATMFVQGTPCGLLSGSLLLSSLRKRTLGISEVQRLDECVSLFRINYDQ